MKFPTTKTTTISWGPTRFDQRGVTLRKAGHYGQARNTFSTFPFRVSPIPASRPMPSGVFMYMALPPTKDTRPTRRDEKGSDGMGGGVGTNDGKKWPETLGKEERR